MREISLAGIHAVIAQHSWAPTKNGLLYARWRYQGSVHPPRPIVFRPQNGYSKGPSLPSLVVACSQLSKCYRTYQRPADRLWDGFRALRQRWFKVPAVSSGSDFWALRDVTFDVAQGETVAIIGRNGSGKSTLLQLLAGTLNPTAGEVSVCGRISALLELGVGFNPEFSGLENVQLNAAVLGLLPEVLAERLESILDFAEIGDHIFMPVKTYSSGMYIRLAFSVMIHSAPDVLIVDEALAVGDAAFQAKCMAWIRKFQAAGGSLLFVSHDVASVRALCHRAIYLEHGRVKDMGPTGEVTDHYLRDVHQAQNSALVCSSIVADTSRLGTEASAESAGLTGYAERRHNFEARWATTRQGMGDARVRLVELLNEQGEPVEVVEFNAQVHIRIFVECLTACSASVNYKIRDRHLVSVVGADFLMAEYDLLAMSPGQTYLVEYQSRLPLMAGDYSLRLSITQPIDKHAQAVFIDIVEVALPFKVLPSPLGWIYTQTYLPNTLNVSECPASP